MPARKNSKKSAKKVKKDSIHAERPVENAQIAGEKPIANFDKSAEQAHAEKPAGKLEKPEKTSNTATIVFIAACVIIALVAYYFLTMPPDFGPITHIQLNGQEYVFSYDIRDEWKVPIKNPVEIYNLLSNSGRMLVVFNDTNQSGLFADNPAIQVTGYNVVYKIVQYATYKGKLIDMTNVQPLSNVTLERLTIPAILLLGPNTGAKETSVSLMGDKIIVVQGTTLKDFRMAGDRLVMLAIGLNVDKPNYAIVKE